MAEDSARPVIPRFPQETLARVLPIHSIVQMAPHVLAYLSCMALALGESREEHPAACTAGHKTALIYG